MPLNINFNKALIISLLFHLFWFFMITVVVIPVGGGQNKMADISFLGAILDDNPFKHQFDISDSRFHRTTKRPDIFNQSNPEGAVVERIPIYDKSDHFFKEKAYSRSIDEILETEKRIADTVGLEIELNEPAVKESQVLNLGPRRTVIFKPPLSSYRELGTNSAKENIDAYFKIELKVVILPSGDVKFIEILQTCGQPELDLKAIRYVEKWKFVPLSPDKPKEDQVEAILLELEKV